MRNYEMRNMKMELIDSFSYFTCRISNLNYGREKAEEN